MISNVHIWAHPDNKTGFFTEAVNFRELADGEGGTHMIANILADGYLNDIVTASLSPESLFFTENLHGRRAENNTRVTDAYPLATIPRRSLAIDGDPSEAEGMTPIATVEDFNNREDFSRLDVYLTDSNEGVYLMVIVGADGLGNSQREGRYMWRGDAIQFAITHGQPGDQAGYVLFDLANHDERGPQVYRRNFWADQDLRDGLLDLDEDDVKLSVAYDEDTGLVTYKAFFGWEELGLPAPWYESFSIDLAATRGETYPRIAGSVWTSPYSELGEGEDADRAKSGGIFFAPTVSSAGFKWVQCE